jgi:hypothetical protein
MDELRCDSGIKFGELYAEDSVLEVKCRSKWCGAGPGVVVVHGFDIKTGKLVGTDLFRDPINGQKEVV